MRGCGTRRWPGSLLGPPSAAPPSDADPLYYQLDNLLCFSGVLW